MKIKVKLSAILMFSLLMLCSLSVYATGSGKPTNDVKVEVKNGIITMSTSQKDAEIIYATAQRKDPGADDWNYNYLDVQGSTPDRFKEDGSNWYKYGEVGELYVDGLEFEECGDQDVRGKTFLFYAVKTKDGISDFKSEEVIAYNTKLNLDSTITYTEGNTAALITLKIESKLLVSGKDSDCTEFYLENATTGEEKTLKKGEVATFPIVKNGNYVFSVSDCYGGSTTTAIVVTGIQYHTDIATEDDIVKQTDDKTPPEITFTSKDGVTYTVTVTDDVALGKADSPTGSTYTSENGEKELTFTFTASSNGKWSVTAFDKVGNKATKSIEVKGVTVKDSQKEQRDKKKSKQSDENSGEEDPTDSFDKADTLPQTGGIAKYIVILSVILLIVGGFVLYFRGGALNEKKIK